ncbi:Asp23/Gls24 family envelope stress response protein [Streptococcus ferus]|uniref:Asp23/Gls24 family envelope stress response protein n=1 Tax=Streptococcus ferus TaxID=1345 RepID=UPI0035A06E2E
MPNDTINNYTVDHDSNQHLDGTITYTDKVIEKIIGRALQSVEGLLSVNGGLFSTIKNKMVNSEDVTEGVDVEVGTKQVATDLKIVVEYDQDIPAIVDSIKSVISDEVKLMTHLEVIEVNVEVVDIKTKEEFQNDSVTLQDRLTEAGQATGEFISNQASKAGHIISETKEQVEEQIETSRVE